MQRTCMSASRSPPPKIVERMRQAVQVEAEDVLWDEGNRRAAQSATSHCLRRPATRLRTGRPRVDQTLRIVLSGISVTLDS